MSKMFDASSLRMRTIINLSFVIGDDKHDRYWRELAKHFDMSNENLTGPFLDYRWVAFEDEIDMTSSKVMDAWMMDGRKKIGIPRSLWGKLEDMAVPAVQKAIENKHGIPFNVKEIAAKSMKGCEMNNFIARELVRVAKDLLSMEFDTEEAYKKYMKDHPGADKSKHTVKKAPAKKKQDQKPSGTKGHTKSLGKLNPDDTDETKIRVYDSGEGDLDRYSVVVDGKDWESSVNPGMKPMLGLSSGGRSVSQWGEGKEGKHLGKPMEFDKLDKDTREHILQRLKNSGE